MLLNEEQGVSGHEMENYHENNIFSLFEIPVRYFFRKCIYMFANLGMLQQMKLTQHTCMTKFAVTEC